MFEVTGRGTSGKTQFPKNSHALLNYQAIANFRRCSAQDANTSSARLQVPSRYALIIFKASRTLLSVFERSSDAEYSAAGGKNQATCLTGPRPSKGQLDSGIYIYRQRYILHITHCLNGLYGLNTDTGYSNIGPGCYSSRAESILVCYG